MVDFCLTIEMANSPQICLNRSLGKQITQSSFCQGLLRCAYPEGIINYQLSIMKWEDGVMGRWGVILKKRATH